MLAAPLRNVFVGKENLSWYQVMETSLNNELDREKEFIILGGGTGRVSFGDFSESAFCPPVT